MKKKFRLTEKNSFKEVMDGGKAVRTPYFLVFIQPNQEQHLRVGISVSKKVGNAIIRARVRRQIRAFFTIYNIYEKRYDIVIVVKQAFLTRTFQENKDELLERIDSIITKGETKSE
jgi:ribonuclease P protein component